MPKAVGPQGTASPQVPREDLFIPSSQTLQSQATAQAAGLFSVPQPSFFSAAAHSVLRPNAPAQAGAAQAATPVAPAAHAGTAASPATAASVATASTTSLAAAQEQLQSLNLALAALGLSTQDIRQLDQIASIRNNYNPSAYTAQAYQLEVLAQKAPAQTVVTTKTNAQAVAANANAPAAKVTIAATTAKG